MRRVLRVGRRTIVVVSVLIVAALVAARTALPSLLREIIASKASEALRARVEVGSVELSLLGGRVGLRDVVVFPPGGGADDEPILGWKLLAAELDYEALRQKQIRLREIVLDTPRMAVDRLADGQLNLQALAPAAASPTAVATAAPTEAPGAAGAPAAGGLPPGWSFALDRFVLRGGGLRFRDLFVPQSEPIEIEIPAIEVGDVSFEAGRFDRPARLRVDVRSEGGSVKIESEIRVQPAGLGLSASLDAASLPLRRARVYVSGVGWSSFHGLTDASLRYALETGAKNELRGAITVRDLEVKTAKLAYPALAWRRLAVALEPVDLLARAATVRSIQLDGASIAATLRGGEVLPVVAPEKPAASAAPAATPTPPASPTAASSTQTAPGASAPAVKPWEWSLEQLRVTDSQFLVERPGKPLAIGVALATGGIGSRNLVRGAPPVPVTLDLKIGRGTIDTVGKLRFVPPGFGGSVRYAKLDVRDVIPTSPSLPQRLVRGAILGGELVVEAGLGARGESVRAAQSVRLRGRLAIDGLEIVANDPRLFAAGWKRFDLRVGGAELPGALATGPAGAPQPIRVAISSVRIDSPWVTLTRDASGVVLPQLGDSTAKPAPAPAGRPAAAAAPPPELSVAAADVHGGRIVVVDRTVTPYFTGEIAPLDLEARAIRLPGPSVESFKLSAAGFQGGKLAVSGALRPDRSGDVEVTGTRIGLSQFNPYVTHASTYGIGGGALSIQTKATFTGGTYDTSSQVTVHQLALEGAQGDTLFQQQFGISLSTALALLTDLEGDIHLDVPVRIDPSGTQVDLVAVVGSALKAAFIGAALSPLKMLGAVAGGLGSGGEAPAEPPPAETVVGRADLSPAGLEHLGQIASLLANRPALAVNLAGLVSADDVRFLAEQNVRVKLSKNEIDFEAITGLLSRAARKRVLAALNERAIGKPGELSADDQKVLDALLEDAEPPTAADCRALAGRRVERAIAWLGAERGIDAKRLRPATPETVEPKAPVPGVRVTLALPPA